MINNSEGCFQSIAVSRRREAVRIELAYKEIVKGTNEMINLQLNRVEEMGMNKIYITSYLIRSDGSP
jgi:hypothetical protein